MVVYSAQIYVTKRFLQNKGKKYRVTFLRRKKLKTNDLLHLSRNFERSISCLFEPVL
jgi:hypothetical protein